MIPLQFVKIKENNEYLLYIPMNKTKISLILEFHQMDKPRRYDTLFLDETLIDRNSKNFAQPYAFKPLEENDEKRLNRADYAYIFMGRKKINLIRLYG